MINNKKASMFGVVIFIVIAIVVTVFFAAWTYSFHFLTTTLTSIPTENGVNISGAAQNTFGNIDNNLFWLKTIAFAIMFGEILGFLVLSYYTKRHPVFYFLYVGMIIVDIVVAVVVSNTYEKMLTDPVLGTMLQSYTASTYVLLNLPIIVTVLGFIGLIIMSIGAIRDPGMESRGVMP
jgi:hypothetical protein